MKRTNPYFDLQYRVDCRLPGQHFDQTIAAFNVDTIAIGYAIDCANFPANHPGWEYTVYQRKGTGWRPIWNSVKDMPK
jgi:hypothetical protein